MLIMIADVLTAADVEEARATLASAPFEDGRATAGWNARLVKNNMQARRSAAAERLEGRLIERLNAHPVFQLAARPKTITPLLFSRSGIGQGYGAHTDDALMRGIRTDLSFTIFLSDPESYDGGELVIESTSGEEEVKLAAGSVVVYPSTTLHRVAEVSRGERLVAAGWVRSYVRDAARREILFDLDTARRTLFEREGKTAEFDLLSKSTANLMRMWAED